MINAKEIPSQSLNDVPKKDCLSPIILLLIWLWIFAIIVGGNIAMFFSSISLQIPNWYYAVLQVGMGVLLTLPLLPLALLWRAPQYRTTFYTWLLGSAFVILLAPIHLLPVTAAHLQALSRIFLVLIYTILIILLSQSRRRTKVYPPLTSPQRADLRSPLSNTSWLFSILIATIFAYPWLSWGALGSLLDTVIQVTFGLVFGLAATVTVYLFLLPYFRLTSSFSIREYIFRGFGIGTLLLILSGGSAFPYGGMQMLLIICLPTLGWTVMALYKANQKRSDNKIAIKPLLPQTLLLGLAAAAPVTLVDPDELILIISATSGDILQWAIYAAGLSAIIGLIASLLLSIAVLSRRITSGSSTWIKPISIVMTIIAILVGGWLYYNVGQPGFYGEGLFVILKEQADISEAQYISNYNDRRQFVYDTLSQHADDTQANLRKSLDNMGINYTPYYLVNGLQVQGGPIVRLWLQTQPEVDRILDNPWLRPLPEPLPIGSGDAHAPSGTTWNLEMINADRVWDELGVTGAGIVIGQSDSGVQGDHPELATTYRGGKTSHDYNWFDPWNGTQKPTDIGGHGTHSLGFIVGQNVGVAPEAKWYGCVNLARNLANPALYLNCMQFILAPFPIGGDPFSEGDPTLGAHISNNSWGCPEIEGCDPDSLLPAISALRNAGVFMVASAGNDGPKCESLSDPLAIYGEAYSVGSIDQYGQLSFFSSLGPVTVDGSGRIKPDIIAPGDEVLSAMPKNTYDILSGTSFAGPHVAGVVALMWSANPALIGDIERTEEILSQTAQLYTGVLPECNRAVSTPSTAVGYGIVDAYAAVKMALESR